MLLPTSIASVLALSSLATGTQVHPKRSQQTNVALYAYGVGAGLPIIYADGLAYFGLSNLDNATTSTVVNFSYDDADTSVPWTIASNTSSVTFNETLTLYIIPTSGTFAQIGFAANDSLPEGAVNTGFGFYGSAVAYAASESDYQLSFWAKATSTRGVFGLYWKATGTSRPNGAFPVTVKNTAPVFPDFASEDEDADSSDR
ncbi:hypothetical protein QTJ16_005535 [Diplocarpon rosae]|uniref:Uncharacterized protein n=1 Tax=Diplocarpon rosae TaxID=946125 RepID=A0AAD9SX69_9HELO|nr:hypothetical protein QTJ16_005535 [Diplocarpon rosae]PBP18100.1 hypothetical protein BUE80_DR010959 [Diplocarpon rosae]